MRIETFSGKDDSKPNKAPHICSHVTIQEAPGSMTFELAPSGTSINIPADAHRLDIVNDRNHRSVSYTWNGSDVEIKTYAIPKAKRRFRG